VPTVLGTNADETGRDVPLTFSETEYQLVLASAFPNPVVRAQVANLYSSTTFGSPRRAYVALTSDVKFTCPARTVARALASTQTEPVYRYFFTEVPDAPASSVFGAFHGLELLYLFDVLDIEGNSPTAAERSLSASMQAYWAGLATNGIPAAAGAPAWTPYDAGRDNHLVLDAAALAMGDGVVTSRCDFWSSFGA